MTRKGNRYAAPKHIGETTLGRLLAGTTRRVPEDSAQGSLFMSGNTRAGMTVYYAGNLALLQRPCVAIVGTRKVSEAGEARTRRLARELALEGIVVVSGLAMGVDTAAHTACLEAGGSTIAVIGTPMDTATPTSNQALQELIYRCHLLISPFPIGSRVQKGNFPQRNQVMAAIADATVVMEASDTSGTLHQSKEAVGLGRWLFIARSCAEDPALSWPRSFLKAPTAKVLYATRDVIERVGRAERHAPLRVLYGGSECPRLDGTATPSAATEEDTRALVARLQQHLRGRRAALVAIESAGDPAAFADAMAAIEPLQLVHDENGPEPGREVQRILVVDELRDGTAVQDAHRALRRRGFAVPVVVARRRWSWLPSDHPEGPFEDTLDNLVHDPPNHASLTVQVNAGGRELGAYRGLATVWMPWARRGDFAAAVKSLGKPLSRDLLATDAELGVAGVDLLFDMGQLWFHAMLGQGTAPAFAAMLRLRRRFFSVKREPEEVHVMVGNPGDLSSEAHALGDGWRTVIRPLDSLPGAMLADFLLDLVLADWAGMAGPNPAARARLLERLGWNGWGNLRAETRTTETKFSVVVASPRPADVEVRAFAPPSDRAPT